MRLDSKSRFKQGSLEISKVKMELVLLTCILGFFIIQAEGSATLTVPTAGNCGDDTVLTCSVTGSVGYTSWNKLTVPLVANGAVVRPEDSDKYTETRGTTSFTLTIHNTDITDAGEYKCSNGFDESKLVRLNIECKASAAVFSVTNGKKITVTVDQLYPSSLTISATFRKENAPVTVPGSESCSSNTQYPGYYRCIWSSRNSLADGSYTYSIVVTTITQADPLTGSFEIVSPRTPVISNTVNLNASRVVVYGNEVQSLTIQCTSTGGYPTPTVEWYKDSVSSSNQLASISTGTLQNDGTYTVTLEHTFTPIVSDDRKSFICKSYYPQADSAHRGSKTTSVILFLTLKPSQPTVIQVKDVFIGGTVEVRCTTTGSRPAANITWSYQGTSSTGVVTSTLDTSSETYTVISIFRRTVTAADNGRSLQCVVTHTALVSPPERTASINIHVQLPASSTSITGNKVMTATGTATLTLTCTTGSSNPASDITWKNGSVTITSNRPYTTSTGDNNGVVRSQQLVLTPTRYMDGDIITCSVSNTVSQSPVTDTATLNLNYSPFVDLLGLQQTTLNEGGTEVLSCKVDSKPLATIIWYHDNIQQSQETPSNNMLSYSLTPVNRTQYGTYRCKANNGINPEDEEQISISIRFKSSTTTITGNSNIIANGQNTLSLVCTSGSSNPISDITWRINNKVTSSTASLSDQSGGYSGMKRRRRLTLTPTRDNDGDIVSCEATNSLGTSARAEESLNLKYRPLIDPMYDRTAIEGSNAVLPCNAFSKPASTFRWYKQGHSGILHQGIGTLDNNQLAYTKSNVRRTDAGTYRCTADNGIETADEKTVLLTVYYQTITFYVEGYSDQSFATVDEQDVGINFTCLVDDSTTSTITIQFNGQILKEASEAKSLSYLRSNVECSHAGVYTCTGTSIYGQTTSKIFNLFVRCSPRPLRHLRQNITSKLYVPVTLSFTALAYPEPGPKGFSWHKENGIRWTPLLSNEDLHISSSGLQSNLTIWNVSSTDYSQYRVTVTNSIDSYEQYLFLTRDVTNTDNKKEESDNKALVVGLSLGSVCIILLIYGLYLTILYKRQRTINKESSNNSNEHRTHVNLAYNSDVKGKQRKQIRQNKTNDQQVTEEGSPHQYSDLSQCTRDDKATYDLLQAN